MGPVAEEQLMVAPPFYITMMDLFGPLRSFVPGFERNTRNRKVLEAEWHVMTAGCPITRIVDLMESIPPVNDNYISSSVYSDYLN